MEHVGPYEVRGSIGRGGMGVVVRGWDPRLDREVAIKILDTAGATDAQRERFRREATAQARLRHPHIAAVHDVGEHERRAYIVMDLVPGESLDARLESKGPLAPRAAADLVRKLARAIAHAHENGILHRDLKPANVLLTRDLEPVLVDFGLAKHLGGNNPSLSRHGAFLGTPGYWPPEQAAGELARIGPPADVYGLGALLFACLTGRAPHVGDTLFEVLAAVRQRPEPPSTVREGIPPELDDVCMRCLETDPAARYFSAWELAEDLEAVGRGERPRARPARPTTAGAPTPGARRGGSRRATLALIGVVALGVTLAAVAVAVAVRRPPDAAHVAPLAAELAEVVATLERDGGRAALDAVAPVLSRAAAEPAVPQATRIELRLLRLQALVAAAVASGDEAEAAAVNGELAAWFGDPYALDADLLRVEALRRTGDLVGAHSWLGATLARHPSSARHVRRQRGLLGLQLGRFKDARDDLQKVFDEGGELDVAVALGRALVGAAEPGAALDLLRGLVAPGRPGATSADVWTALGEALAVDDPLERLPASRQLLAEAARALDRALELDASHAGALLARARLRHATGSAASGRLDAERAREVLAPGPDRARWLDAVVLSACLALETGELEAARARYEEAVEAAPTHAPALAGLGHVALKQGATSRGAALLARARAARLDPAASSEASRLFRSAAAGAYLDVDRPLARVLQLDPFFAEALLERARRADARDRAFARRLLERAVSVDPTSAAVRERLGCLLELAGEATLAEAAFDVSSSLATTDLERSRALRGLAATRAGLGRLDEAAQALELADEALAARGPPDLETLPVALACEALRATVCARRDDADGLAAATAREHDLQALSSALAREGVRGAVLLRRAKRQAEAIQRLDLVIALEPGLASAWLARAGCYGKLGNFVPGLLDACEAARLDPFVIEPHVGTVYQVDYAVDLARVKTELKLLVARYPDEARVVALVPLFALLKCEYKKRVAADVDEGLAAADRTLALDPRFVLALDVRAQLRVQRTFEQRSSREQVADLDAADRDVARALELAPRLSYTHYVGALVAARRAVCGPAEGASAAIALAIARLEFAVVCGFRAARRLRSEPQLDALRSEFRFERLVAELEAKYPTPPAEGE